MISTHAKWCRPATADVDPSRDTLVFQQIDLDHYIDSPVPGFSKRLFSQAGPVTRMFGITKDGRSILCHIHGFRPYFYVELSETISPDLYAQFRVSTSACSTPRRLPISGWVRTKTTTLLLWLVWLILQAKFGARGNCVVWSMMYLQGGNRVLTMGASNLHIDVSAI